MAENTTPVTLTVGSFAAREVMAINYNFEQATDIEGQLAGLPRGGRINVTVKAMNDGNAQLLGWMLQESQPLDVKIDFQNTVDGKEMKSITGKGCYCVKYKETWEEGIGHKEELQIVCQELHNGAAEFKNNWK